MSRSSRNDPERPDEVAEEGGDGGVTPEAHILLVEDEPSLIFTLHDSLESEGFNVSVHTSGSGAVEEVSRLHPDLILLDLMLPGRSGLDVCRELRERQIEVPVIMLTALDQETDKVHGLDTGADDYVTKPFGVKELLARIRVQLRRRASTSEAGRDHVRLGHVEVNLRKGLVLRPGSHPIPLSTREVQIIRYFLENANKPVSRDDLLEQVWNYEQTMNTRTVDVHVSKLRNKIESDSEEPRFLITLHGVGYMLKLG